MGQTVFSCGMMLSECIPAFRYPFPSRSLCPGVYFLALPFPSRLVDCFSLLRHFADGAICHVTAALFFSLTPIFILNVLRDLKVPSSLEISHPVQSSFRNYGDEAASLGIIPMLSVFRFRVPVGRNSGGNEGRFFVVFQNSSVVFLFFFFRATKISSFSVSNKPFRKAFRPGFLPSRPANAPSPLILFVAPSS